MNTTIYHDTVLILTYSEQNTARIIAQELGYLPLALDQAGAYIQMTQYSLGRYLKEYKTNASYLLSKRWKGGKQDRSVFATWEVSFNAIQQKTPNAARLLLICGFLNNADIWEDLLKCGMKLETHGMTCVYIIILFNNLRLLIIALTTTLMYWHRSGTINSDIIFILARKTKRRR